MKFIKILAPMAAFIFVSAMLSFTPDFSKTKSEDLSLENTQPVELGKVNWERDFEKGVSLSKQSQKPIFLLFQEVPGCSTCRNYGQNVLSHPLIVEAIETLFVPVAIFNNKEGKDAQVLKYYGEPSWNNPVVRIVDENKKNIINRVSGNYSSLGIVQAMIQALNFKAETVPNYLKLLEETLTAEVTGVETATFSMYCFWTGEKNLANVDGVLETQAGWMKGREVVEVKYNPNTVSYETLVEEAQQTECASHVFTEDDQQEGTAKEVVGKDKVSPSTSFRLDKEPKYYLSKSLYRYIPMTQLQAAKVNSAIGSRQSPDTFLSPNQLNLLGYIKKHPKKKWESTINVDLLKAWKNVEKLKG